jgi:hypothetical protein
MFLRGVSSFDGRSGGPPLPCDPFFRGSLRYRFPPCRQATLDLNVIKAINTEYMVSAVACATAATSFWVYGSARAMEETVGFSANAVFVAGSITAALLLVPALMLWLLLRGLAVWSSKLFQVVVVLAACVGAGAAESRLLLDELNFREQVALAPANASARDRAWPFHGTTLVYQPTRGIHSTD